MQNFPIMQGFKSSNNLNKNIPNFLFFYVCFSLLVAANLLENVAIICILHHQAQTATSFINKSFFVRYYIRIIDTGKNSHFI